MKNTFQFSKGFTLIELILYVSIVSTTVLLVANMLHTILATRVKNQTVEEVEQAGGFVMQQITQTIRNATGVDSPTPGNSANNLSLSVVEGAKNPTKFDRSSNSVRIIEGISPSLTLTSNKLSVTDLNFQNLSRPTTQNTLRIQFSISHKNPEGQNEYDYSQTFTTSASLRR